MGELCFVRFEIKLKTPTTGASAAPLLVNYTHYESVHIPKIVIINARGPVTFIWVSGLDYHDSGMTPVRHQNIFPTNDVTEIWIKDNLFSLRRISMIAILYMPQFAKMVHHAIVLLSIFSEMMAIISKI